MAAILGIVAAAALGRWGGTTLSTVSGQGHGRSIALAMQLAQRQAVSEGTSAAVVFTRSGGVITSASVVRAADGGDEVVDETFVVPAGVAVQAATDRWEFDYTGALAAPVAGGTVSVTTDNWTWDVTINAVTGQVRFGETHNP